MTEKSPYVEEVEELLRSWRERQLENLAWRDRYFVLKEEVDMLRKQLGEAQSVGSSGGGPDVERLKEENAALREKCEILLEAMETARASPPPSPGLRQVQSMRGLPVYP